MGWGHWPGRLFGLGRRASVWRVAGCTAGTTAGGGQSAAGMPGAPIGLPALLPAAAGLAADWRRRLCLLLWCSCLRRQLLSCHFHAAGLAADGGGVCAEPGAAQARGRAERRGAHKGRWGGAAVVQGAVHWFEQLAAGWSGRHERAPIRRAVTARRWRNVCCCPSSAPCGCCGTSTLCCGLHSPAGRQVWHGGQLVAICCFHPALMPRSLPCVHLSLGPDRRPARHSPQHGPTPLPHELLLSQLASCAALCPSGRRPARHAPQRGHARGDD